jgi:hypothetical protein
MNDTQSPRLREFFFQSIVTVQTSSRNVDTALLFNRDHAEEDCSPIDQFIENANGLNLIFINSIDNSPVGEVGRLVLLGYMSAVESYFRALFRGLINVDEYACRKVESLDVSYGAALHHKPEILAEALFEEHSFSSSYGVKEGIRNFSGFKGDFPNDVKSALEDYKKICEIRHCCVHRFGKLGAKNAIRLGLNDHRRILEKPLLLSEEAVEDISEVLRNIVKTINNFLFRHVIERTAENKIEKETNRKFYSEDWYWNYTKDRKRFLKYYNLFKSRKDSRPSAPAKAVYDDLREYSRKKHWCRPIIS